MATATAEPVTEHRRLPAVAAIAATVLTELKLRSRSQALPVLLAFVFALCALLVPDPSAHYAVVTMGNRKPIMSADTALVAAGIVFGTILLPVYALALDIGTARDRRNMLDRLYLTSPVSGIVVSSARLFASMMFVLLTTLLALIVVSSTILARYNGVPAPSAVALFLLIVVPVGMFAALLAAVLDRYLPERNGAKTALAFGAWMAVVMTSITTRRDLFGMSYLKHVMAVGPGSPSFSVGVVTTQGMPSVLWQTAPLTSDFVWSRLGLIALIVAAGAGLGFLLRLNVNAVRSDHAIRSDGAGPVVVPIRVRGGVGHDVGYEVGHEVHSVPAAPRFAVATATATASTLATARGIAARWLGRSRIAWAAIVLTLVLSIRPGGAPGVALAVALTVPMIITSRTSVREARVAATLEVTTAAFFRPSPALMHGWVLALLAIAPALPALARMPVLQAATAVLGVVASVFWLMWTHRCAPPCVPRPLLGIAIFATIWYVDVFNDIPAQLDVLGLWHASVLALLIATFVACGMVLLVARYDRGADPERMLRPIIR